MQMTAVEALVITMTHARLVAELNRLPRSHMTGRQLREALHQWNWCFLGVLPIHPENVSKENVHVP